MPDTSKKLRLGARGSLLSRMQSGMILQAVQAANPGTTVELVIVTTSGDTIQDRPLHEFGGKGLFTKELEQALLRGDVDFAVHSFKDVPVTMPLVDVSDLVIASVPPREDVRDVLASAKARRIEDLPRGSKVGTGSLRRQAQILALRPDVTVLPIRGNVDTRIRKLKSGEYDAVILAYAGLKRSGLFDESCMTPIPAETLVPSAGQGALALQCRADRPDVRAALERLNDRATFDNVALERQVVRLLNGDCHSPIGAYAIEQGGGVILQVIVAGDGGTLPVYKARVSVSTANAADAPQLAVEQLRYQGYGK